MEIDYQAIYESNDLEYKRGLSANENIINYILEI